MRVSSSKTFRIFFLFVCIVFSTACLNTTAAADSLKYVMNSFIKIKTSAGKVICVDPALVNEFSDSVDILLITHEHGDHNDVNRVKRKTSCVTIRVADALQNDVYQTFNIDGIKITAVPAYNNYHPRASSVGFVIEIDTLKIYHPGDTGRITEMNDLAALNITHAFFPMDGTYTMTPELATEAADAIKAKYDIPFHTVAGQMGYSDPLVSRFTSTNKVIVRPGSTISLSDVLTSVDGVNVQPKSFNLFQNYPNPFNPNTSMQYTIGNRQFVSLKIYDVLGKEVAVLVNEEKAPGNYKIQFDASGLTSGTYYYTFRSGGRTESRKMILLK